MGFPNPGEDRWQDRSKKSSSATRHLRRWEQGAEPTETHLRGCAQPLLCSDLSFGRQLSCGLRNIRSIPDPIHSQKSLCIPKHSYFPQLTDILNKSTVYFGCHGRDGGLHSDTAPVLQGRRSTTKREAAELPRTSLKHPLTRASPPERGREH